MPRLAAPSGIGPLIPLSRCSCDKEKQLGGSQGLSQPCHLGALELEIPETEPETTFVQSTCPTSYQWPLLRAVRETSSN